MLYWPQDTRKEAWGLLREVRGLVPVDWVGAILGLVLYFGAAIYMAYDPETCSGYTGWGGHGTGFTTIPPFMVRFLGCAMLAVPLALLMWRVGWPVGVGVGLVAAGGLHYAAGKVWPG